MDTNNEAHEVEVQVVEEIPAHTQKELKKFDAVAKGLAELREECMPMVIEQEDIEDDERADEVRKGFELVYATRRKVQKKRYAVEHLRKDLTEDAVLHQKAVNERAKEIKNKLVEMQNHLLEQEAKVNAHAEKKKKAAAEALAKLVDERMEKLSEYGSVAPPSLLGKMDDAQFEETLEAARQAKEAQEAAKAEVEARRAKEAQAAKEKQQALEEELAAERAEREEETARLDKIEAERQEAEAARAEAARLEDQERRAQAKQVAAEEKEAAEELTRQRAELEAEREAFAAERLAAEAVDDCEIEEVEEPKPEGVEPEPESVPAGGTVPKHQGVAESLDLTFMEDPAIFEAVANLHSRLTREAALFAQNNVEVVAAILRDAIGHLDVVLEPYIEEAD